jgi:multisubunit Na+/H+ antiporter MnhE subunit
MTMHVVSWLTWWGALTALWLVLAADLSFAEVAAGMTAAALAATAAEVARSRGLARFAPKPQWVLSAWRLPGRVLLDCWLLIAALWRTLGRREPIHGVFRTVPLPTGGGDARSAARRALITIAISLSPNTYAIGTDREADMILVHQLIRRRHAPRRTDPWWPK